MSQDFIDKVRAIVMSNISDEKFGVRKLASILGLSATHTLRKVKAATGKSVNQYIRELQVSDDQQGFDCARPDNLVHFHFLDTFFFCAL